MSETPQATLEPLFPGKPLPLVCRPVSVGLELTPWAAQNRGLIEAHLSRHGAILFRNFRSDGEDILERFIPAVSGALMEYHDRATPRTEVKGRVYTATDYPADQSIFLHNESSFAQVWPMKIFFHCSVAPQQGGETPVADVRRVLARIGAETRAKFARLGVMVARNFAGGLLGLPWQTVFQTNDRALMEQYCKRAGIRFEWQGENRLRTRQIRPATARHPRTGEEVWFNHAAALHVSTLDPLLRKTLLKMFREETLPNNTYYGDGSPIEDSVLAEIRRAYDDETVAFSWQQGDLLALDNMLAAHGRRPFTGPRKILVGMAEPMSWDELPGLTLQASRKSPAR